MTYQGFADKATGKKELEEEGRLFFQNLSAYYADADEGRLFYDLTIVPVDGGEIKAHKFLLASQVTCSRFLRRFKSDLTHSLIKVNSELGPT